MNGQIRSRIIIPLSCWCFLVIVSSQALAEVLTRFDSVKQVESELRTQSTVQFYEKNGWLLAESGFYLWSFTQQGHPAHPAVVERLVFQHDGAVRVRTRQICKKSERVCAQLSAEFESLNQNISQTIREENYNEANTIKQPGLEIENDPTFGWSLTQRDYGMLVLIKRGPKENESLVSSAQLFRVVDYATPEEFLAAEIKRRKENHIADPRVEDPIASEELTHRSDAICVAYSYAYKDSGAVLANGEKTIAKFISEGLRCIHPFDKTIGVQLSYSKRFFESIDAEAHAEAARKYFDAIHFVPFPN